MSASFGQAMVRLAFTGLVVFVVPAIAFAGDANAPLPAADPSVVNNYCNAFLKDAENARESRQKADLLTIQGQIEKKLAEVKENTAALDSWVSRREAILARATNSLLKIYEAMEPAAAAAELSKLDDLTASAVLRMLKPKKSSDILVEMDPTKAATLVAVMASDAKLKSGT